VAAKVANQTNKSTTETQPTLDESTREFVKLALGAGLIELEELKKIVVSLLSESNGITRDRLAHGLVGAGLLTDWQVKKLFAGRGRGFFLGSYKLLRPLGKGGMGVVYLGEHRVMKRPMALKVLHSESASDAQRIARFQDEARAAAQLDHPNIVRAYDFAEDNGKLFIVMEYIEGIDLENAIQRDGVMPIEAAVDAVLQAAHGLAHAHGRGIVHRDIKPANLLLRSDGVLKVSDMGLARIGWQGEAPNEAGRSRLLGTSEFLAPEQALDSRSVDGRADIYSLGCTLYYLLTGRPPYPGATLSQRIAKHQTSAPPDIRVHRTDCPPALSNLAIRMMAKRPEDRIPSATELISQLSRVANSGLGQGRGGQLLRQIAPASDTISNGSLRASTLSDSSLGGGVDQVVVVDDGALLDFASLPPVLTNVAAPKSPNSRGATARQFPAAVRAPMAPPPRAAQRPQATARPKQGASLGNSQNILLGIGLAFACVSLVAVVGIGIYISVRPEKKTRPVIKSTEGEGGSQIIILGDEQ
jgi:eukaryotic-like serine/threonine-protein kinase